MSEPDAASTGDSRSGSPLLDRPMTVSGCALCVDLDGTLVKSDTLQDSLCLMLRRRPGALWRVPLWILGGRARLKEEVCSRVTLDAARLPYNQPLLKYLKREYSDGRAIYLATGADRKLAEDVARHLGLFAGVLASDGTTNLTGKNKLASLQAQFGEFDYIGNAPPDEKPLRHARQAMVANPTLSLRMLLARKRIPIARRFEDRRPIPKAILKAMRIHQWAKNALLFLPLLLSHSLQPVKILATIAAFCCFSFVASANYIVNDLIDLENDRHHPKKRLRPFAAGDLSVVSGLGLSLALLAIAAAILPFLPLRFAEWLGVYLLVTSTYSIYFKRVPLVDVLVLAGLYALRLQAGGAATETNITPWLTGLATFLFLSLAMVKRFSELEGLRERGHAATRGRGYLVADLEQIRSFGTSSAYAAVVIFCLYISRPDVSALYRHPTRLWMIVPFMLLWLNRVWLLASRGDLDEDPVIFALRDRMSLLLWLCVGILAVLAV